MGASSEFRPLSVIYRRRKDKKEDVTKTTVDTLTLHTGFGLNGTESIQLCLFPPCDTAA